jgi:dihydroorotase
MPYDLVVKNGRVLDPASGVDDVLDVAVKGNRIEEVAPDIDASEASQVIDADGLLVAPGFIDMHAHAFYLGDLGLGKDLEAACYPSGVTSLVDGGSAGAATFPGFREYIIEPSEIRIFSFLHISSIGLADIDVGESTYLTLHDPQRAADMAIANRDVIFGIKVRQQAEVVGENGLEPLRLAKQAAALAGGLPVMVHVTNPPVPLTQILELLEPGDIVSHFLHGKANGVLNEDGDIFPAVINARENGIIFDVGHGRFHVSFEVARAVFAQNFLPDTISTDLTRGGRDGTVKDLAHTLSKLMNLGLDIETVIACATSNPARILGKTEEIGTLKKGAFADIAVFELESGEFSFQDSEEEVLKGSVHIVPKQTVQNGRVVWQKEG